MTQRPVQPRTAPDTTPRLVRSRHTIPVIPPFRLDLTVSALRRLPTNVIDVLTSDGRYLHAVPGSRPPSIVHVRQSAATALEVTIDADPADARDQRIIAQVARTLGVDRDLTEFYSLPTFGIGPLAWIPAPLSTRRPRRHESRTVLRASHPVSSGGCSNPRARARRGARACGGRRGLSYRVALRVRPARSRHRTGNDGPRDRRDRGCRGQWSNHA